jgi:archaeosortase A (PGF-CTERM-specific)
VFTVVPLGLVQTADRVSEPLVWAAIGVFLLAVAAEWVSRRRSIEIHDRHPAILLGGLAWGLFGLFWLTMVPYFYFENHSPIEAVMSLAALPACLYTGYLLLNGRTSLLILTRAVTFMGLFYLPVMLIDPVRIWLIEVVAGQTLWGMELLGYSPEVVQGDPQYHGRAVNYFDFEPITGHGYSTYIVLSCTGIGSITIFGGLVTAVTAPLRRKVAAFVAAAGIIWILNIARNVFVGLASPLGWFDYGIFHSITALMVGESVRTSFFVSHTLISQSLSIVALLGITMLVLRILPEITTVLDEVLFVLTGTEYDLAETLDIESVQAGRGDPVRTDGGDA